MTKAEQALFDWALKCDRSTMSGEGSRQLRELQDSIAIERLTVNHAYQLGLAFLHKQEAADAFGALCEKLVPGVPLSRQLLEEWAAAALRAADGRDPP